MFLNGSKMTFPWCLARKLETRMLLTKRLSKLYRARNEISSRYLIHPLSYGKKIQRTPKWMLCVVLVQMKRRVHCRITYSSWIEEPRATILFGYQRVSVSIAYWLIVMVLEE